MEKALKIFITVFVFLFLGCFGDLEVKAQSTITVVGNHAPPFRIIEGTEFSGIYFDIIKEIGKRINVKIKFENQPFKQALFSMKRGVADVMCGPNRNPEREAYMVYLNATLARANKAFYVHPDSPVIMEYADLKDKIIAVHTGKVYFDRFDKDSSLKKEAVSKYEQAIKKVFAKRNDVVIMPEQEGDYLLKQLGIRLKKSPFIVEGKISYITISKKSPVLKLRRKIEEAMNQINADGTVQKILNYYKSN